mgnify:CR=1 FL=1
MLAGMAVTLADPSGHEGAVAVHSVVNDASRSATARRNAVWAAVRIAGPKARDVLQKLTDADVSATAFRFLDRSAGLLLSAETPSDRLGFLRSAGTGVGIPGGDKGANVGWLLEK